MPLTTIMDKKGIARSLERIAYEIIESNQGADKLGIIGIRTRGAFLAERLAKLIKRIEKIKVPVGAVDITMYRDDVQIRLEQPIIQQTDIEFSIDDMKLVLVDDVLYTGRTVRAALNEVADYGRPQRIQLAVLVDRGHRELPIRADFVGLQLQTFQDENVTVNLTEKDHEDSVMLQQANGGEE